MARILTVRIATHTGIRTRLRSSRPSGRPSLLRTTLPYQHPLLLQGRHSAASVMCLSPGGLAAPLHSTSELLRTLSRVAASKPTSWLSGQSDLLAH